MNAKELHAVISELKSFEGGQIQAVHQPEPEKLILRIHSYTGTHLLLISCDDDRSRMHLVESKGQSPQIPYHFCTILRSTAIPARLMRIWAEEDDRVANLELSVMGEDGTPHLQRIVAELTGRNANVFLLDSEGVVTGSMRANRSQKRDNLPGHKFVAAFQTEFRRETQVRFEIPEATADDPFPANRSAAEYFGRADEEWHAEQRRSQTRRILHNRLKKVERAAAAVKGELEQTGKAAELRRDADLLQINYHLLKKGQTEISVGDIFEEGANRTIRLDPALSPRDNIERLYKKARKTERSVDPLSERLLQLEEEADFLIRLEELLDAGAEAVEKVRDKLGLKDEDRKYSKKKEIPRQPFRLFISASGRHIYVGRSAADNDTLTLRISKGDDFWLHASGQAGSHVLIPLEKGEELDSETLIDAATLAAHYSKSASSGSAEVIYARARYVKKPRNAPPGQVTVAQFKSLFVKIDDKRLKRLIADSNKIADET